MATKYVWEGAIPLQIHLHQSEITTLPPPPPLLILGPRLGYLPLLVPLIKPHFSSTLPPGVETVWFDYKGLPLKWYIPTGVLFDLLCAEPERPWNLTVHFRGYPGEILTPCEGEDSVKWSFINSLKEAAYIINGNCKNVMNMSQADQFELWQSVLKGNMESYVRLSSKLKLGPVGEDCIVKNSPLAAQSQQPTGIDAVGPTRSCRIPVRLYVRSIGVETEEMEEACATDSWSEILYLNRPVEIRKDEECSITLESAIRGLLPEIFEEESQADDESNKDKIQVQKKDEIKLIRIQGIKLDPDIPFCWVVNNLKNPEYYLHICVFVGSIFSIRTR